MLIKETKKIKEGFIGQKSIVLPPNIKKIVLKNSFTRNIHLTAIGFYPNAIFHNRARKAGSGQHILLYCINGKGNVFLKDKEYELRPNTYLIIPKNIPHHYKSSITDPWSIYWVHFAGSIGDVIFERYNTNNSVVGAVPFNEKRIETFDLIFDLLENRLDEKSQEIVNIKLLDFLGSFIYLNEIDPAYHQIEPIDQSISFMKKNLNISLSAEELAKQQNLSPTHYARLFKAKTGSSPLQYFNQLKVQKSCQYLYFSDYSVKEICNELGFDDPFYFSRLFKKFMGISPSHYKNTYRSKSNQQHAF